MGYAQLQLRGDTAANWAAANPVLADREMAIETDTRQFKIGDGVTSWNDLLYGGLEGPQGEIGPEGPQGEQGIPGIATGVEFGVLVARDAGIVTGGYPAARSAWGSMTMSRFFAEGMGGDALVAVVVNDTIRHGPVTVASGARVTQAISIPLPQGAIVTFDIIGQGAKRLWAQIDGGAA